MCLGCHATASEAEPWERDDTFSLKEGVQCEMCHGPGSEYMDEDVMMDREAAMLAGLKMPTKEDCLNCHAEKGSHRIVLGPRTYDLDKAWQEIAHPTPQNWEFKKLQPPAPALAPNPGPAYTGVAVCAECHAGAAWGYQFSKWQASKHADAYASLGTAKAREMAAAGGRRGRPADQRAVPEVPCHRVPSAGRRSPRHLRPARRRQLRSVPRRRQRTRRRGGETERLGAAGHPPAENHGADLRRLPRQRTWQTVRLRGGGRGHRPPQGSAGNQGRAALQDAAEPGPPPRRPRTVRHLRGRLLGDRRGYRHAAARWPRSRSAASPWT